MKLRIWNWIAGTGALALVCSMAPAAWSQCGLPNKPIEPSAFHPQLGAAIPRPAAPGLDDYDNRGPSFQPSIVGMWHVMFTAQTQNGGAIPAPGAVIDNSVVVWHSDGTEVMNSSRSAQDGNFCLGVWRQTGYRTYLLNHIPWQGNVYDPTVAAGYHRCPPGRCTAHREDYPQPGR